MTDEIDQRKSVSDRFRRMADRIDHNTSDPFGGAVTIYPPQNGGDPIEILLLDLSPDPAQFWATVQTRISLVLEKLGKDQAQLARFR